MHKHVTGRCVAVARTESEPNEARVGAPAVLNLEVARCVRNRCRKIRVRDVTLIRLQLVREARWRPRDFVRVDAVSGGLRENASLF